MYTHTKSSALCHLEYSKVGDTRAIEFEDMELASLNKKVIRRLECVSRFMLRYILADKPKVWEKRPAPTESDGWPVSGWNEEVHGVGQPVYICIPRTPKDSILDGEEFVIKGRIIETQKVRNPKKMKDYEAVKFNGHAKLIIELNETLRINQMRKENNSLIIEQRQKLEESEDLTHRVWAETNKMGFNIASWVAYFPGLDELPSTKKTRGT